MYYLEMVFLVFYGVSNREEIESTTHTSILFSCSKEAGEEFPNTDPNIISAISIARRLQDPLCEYVKIGPSHLGIYCCQFSLTFE